MSTPIGPALAFYLRNFEDAEAIRALSEAPKGISPQEWVMVRQVLKYQVDREVTLFLKSVMKSGLDPVVVAAGRQVLTFSGQKRLEEHWALTAGIAQVVGAPEAMALGLAIDASPDVGPWLGLFLEYGRKTTTALWRAGAVLSEKNITHTPMINPSRGWQGQLLLDRYPLRDDSTVEDCAAWTTHKSRPVLTDLWDALTEVTRT
jgi:hypothetical protein